MGDAQLVALVPLIPPVSRVRRKQCDADAESSHTMGSLCEGKKAYQQAVEQRDLERVRKALGYGPFFVLSAIVCVIGTVALVVAIRGGRQPEAQDEG